VDGHVDMVRIMLTRTGNPTVPEPATARVVVTVDGRVVLAQAADTTTQAAVEHVIARLRMRLERMALAWDAGHEGDQSL
jgi:ribosome-associated translation inhibitor RaiA